MWMRGDEKNKGFSIVEVMVVVIIIALLSMLALSRYYAFIARGRQAEARANLAIIGGLQETYKYEKEKYNTEASSTGVGAFTSQQCGTSTDGQQMKNELGFRPKDCGELRYGYFWGTVTGTAESTNRTGKFIYPGCNKTDKWELTNLTGKIKQSTGDNVIEKCSQ